MFLHEYLDGLLNGLGVDSVLECREFPGGVLGDLDCGRIHDGIQYSGILKSDGLRVGSLLPPPGNIIHTLD